jgi:hypothetical protein
LEARRIFERFGYVWGRFGYVWGFVVELVENIRIGIVLLRRRDIRCPLSNLLSWLVIHDVIDRPFLWRHHTRRGALHGRAQTAHRDPPLADNAHRPQTDAGGAP